MVGDLWSPEERAIAMSVYSIAPLVGPSTGPLVGGWIAERARWQWVFWSVSIADGILQIAGFVRHPSTVLTTTPCSYSITNMIKILLRETYAPELLKRKARAMRKATQNPNLRSAFERPDRHWTAVMGRGMVKPIVFLGTEPIVQVFALYMAVLYGVLYLTLTSQSLSHPSAISPKGMSSISELLAFVKVFTDQYGESTGIAGIHYLAVALGSTGGLFSRRPWFLRMLLTALIQWEVRRARECSTLCTAN